MIQRKNPEIGKDIDNRVIHVFHSWQYRIEGIICPATHFKSEANLQNQLILSPNYTLSSQLFISIN